MLNLFSSSKLELGFCVCGAHGHTVQIVVIAEWCEPSTLSLESGIQILDSRLLGKSAEDLSLLLLFSHDRIFKLENLYVMTIVVK